MPLGGPLPGRVAAEEEYRPDPVIIPRRADHQAVSPGQEREAESCVKRIGSRGDPGFLAPVSARLVAGIDVHRAGSRVRPVASECRGAHVQPIVVGGEAYPEPARGLAVACSEHGVGRPPSLRITLENVDCPGSLVPSTDHEGSVPGQGDLLAEVVSRYRVRGDDPTGLMPSAGGLASESEHCSPARVHGYRADERRAAVEGNALAEPVVVGCAVRTQLGEQLPVTLEAGSIHVDVAGRVGVLRLPDQDLATADGNRGAVVEVLRRERRGNDSAGEDSGDAGKAAWHRVSPGGPGGSGTESD